MQLEDRRGAEGVDRRPRGIPLRNIRLGNLTAIGAGPAVDLFLDFLGYAAETALRKVVNLHMSAEFFVLFELLLSEAFYLDEIRYH